MNMLEQPTYPKDAPTKQDLMREQIDLILKKIKAESPRIKDLGNWPTWVREDSLIERVPKPSDTKAPGFDAGIACSLDLFPRERQGLSAILHGAYTPEAVAQIREEIINLIPGSETCWWLSACSICDARSVNQEQFLQQIEDFKLLALNPEKCKEKALKEFAKMVSS